MIHSVTIIDKDSIIVDLSCNSLESTQILSAMKAKKVLLNDFCVILCFVSAVEFMG